VKIPVERRGFPVSFWLEAGDIGRLPGRMKGSYILLVRLEQARTMTAGRLPESVFPAGYYAYVGSALNGLRARLARYVRIERKPHWHIDCLLEEGTVLGVYVRPGAERYECTAAERLVSRFAGFTGFGCSDCRCPSHLFYAADELRLKEGMAAALV
jgi:Uri superfamily endonuclease